MTRVARTSAVLAAASLAAGVLSYVLFALLTRHLGPTRAAPVSILWTYWGLSAAAVTFPLQHWIAQSVATHDGFGSARRAMPRIVGLVAGLSVLSGLLAWAGRETLFDRADLTFPGLVAMMTAGASIMGVARGLLTARSSFTALGASLLGEQVARVVPSAVMVVLDVSDPAAYGFVIVAASFVSLVWPPTFRMPVTGDDKGSSSLGHLGASALAQFLGQVVLTGGPVVVAVQSGSPRSVTAVFTVLAIFRAPMILAQSQVAQLTGRWSRLVAAEDRRSLRRIQDVMLFGVAPAAGLAAAFGAIAGDPLVALVFGPGLEVGALAAALVSVGSTVAIVNLCAAVLAIAHGRPGATLSGWALGIGVGATVLLLPLGDAVTGTTAAFVVAECVALVWVLARLRLA